jgi:hypothetical protein
MFSLSPKFFTKSKNRGIVIRPFLAANRTAALLFAAALAAPVFAHAAYFRAGDFYSLPPGSRIDNNLYLTGPTLSLDGDVEGDILGFGRSASFTGKTAGDISFLGGSVNFRGEVGGDLRIVGGNVVVAGEVGGDLVVLGGKVIVLPEARIGQDAILFGGEIVFAGATARDLVISAGRATVSGRVNGQVSFAGGEAKVTEQALIGGNFTYKTKNPSDVSVVGRAVGGRIVYEPFSAAAVERRFFTPSLITAFLLRLAIILSALFLCLRLFPWRLEEIVSNIAARFGQRLLIGLAVFLLTPIAIVFLLLSVVGSLFGLLVAAVYGGLMLLALIFAGAVFGRISFYFLKPVSRFRFSPAREAFVGTLILHLIVLTPVIGLPIFLTMTIAALGSFSEFVYRRFFSRRANSVATNNLEPKERKD